MSLFAQLAARRVPQILGVYVATTWMAIEIGDWLVDKFGLPEQLTAFIFVGMAAMLPAVALVAWNHGAPGRDQWTRTEKVFVPLNVLGAGAALFILAGKAPTTAPAAAAATTMMTMMDEMGDEQTYEVPVDQFHKRLILFFLTSELDSDDDPDAWLSYGLPLMIRHDLDHETPLATVRTPFDADSLKQQLQERGFADLRGAPPALQLNLARQSNTAALAGGRLFRTPDGQLNVQWRLLDAEAGSELLSETVAIDNPLAAADQLSQRIQNALDLDRKSREENDPLRDNLTTSVDAVRLSAQASRRVALDNDYDAAADLLRQAVALDPAFAEAHGELANILFLNGDAQGALAAIAEGLKHDYKLSTASRFLFKARRYLYANDFERGIKVLALWSKVEPQNPRQFRLRGRILAIAGQDYDQAIDALKQAMALDPSDFGLFKELTNIEKARGNYAEAAQYAQKYVDARPEDAVAQETLAGVYLAANDLVRAEQAFKQAELLSPEGLGATLGLASLAIRQGQLNDANQRIEGVLARDLSPQQRADALSSQAEVAYAAGRIRKRLGTLDALDVAWQKFMPPLMRSIQIGLTRADALMLLGDFEEAGNQISGVGATLQPPLDGFIHLPTMSLKWRQGRYEEAMQSLNAAETFAASRSDPAYLSMLAFARAHRFALDEDKAGTIAQVARATELLDTSFLNASQPSVFALELQVDLARLLHRVSAVEAAQNLIERILNRAPFLATAHALRAQLWVDLEDLEKAHQSVEVALNIWSGADDDYVYYVAARALQAQLGP